MALTDKLRDLDQRFLPGTRNDGEDAETYLRRVASGRAISPAQAGDVMAALQAYFGIEPNTNGDESDEQKDDEPKDGEPKDEADEEKSEDSEDEKSDDES